MSESSPREQLVDRVVAETAAHGLRDRSLRDLAAAVGTSHRMLLYHFGSHAGLIAAVVARVEADQRAALRALAADAEDPADLVRRVWARVSAEALRPFVRLFFESLALSSVDGPGGDLTDAWVRDSDELATAFGSSSDALDARIGIAVVRGLLIDVLSTGDVDTATAALERFLERWNPAGSGAGQSTAWDASTVRSSRSVSGP